MADFKHIIPFILDAEGGYANNPADKGGETMKGITYSVWVSVFGESHGRFMDMSQEDWGQIFKNNYWDAMLGNKINSQRVADLIVDWVWGSGKHFPEKDVQEVLNHSFGTHLATDGVFGQATIDAINTVDDKELYYDLVQRHIQYVNSIVANNPTQEVFLKGWCNRMDSLTKFENNGNN
jgi:lysozyme family protein